MQLVQRQLRLALAVLLASAAVLLAVGTTVEHHQPNKTTQATTPVSGATTGGQAGEDAHAGTRLGNNAAKTTTSSMVPAKADQRSRPQAPLASRTVASGSSAWLSRCR